MIDKKLFLYILGGVIIFALWEAWQKDYEHKEQTAIESPITSGKQLTPNTNNTKPQENNLKPTRLNIVEKTPESRLVKVHTDVLDVTIDTLGGNVVKADLLKYPNVKYQTKPVTLLSDDPASFYVIESSLVSESGPDSEGKPAKYLTQQKEYVLDPTTNENLNVKLFWSGKGINITKTFVFIKGKYNFAVNYEVVNNSQQSWLGRLYAEIRRKNVDAAKGWFQFNTYTGAAISSAETPYEKISFSDIESAAKNNKEFIRESQGGWAAMQQRYFLSVWIPPQDKNYRYFSSVNNGVYTIGLNSGELQVAPGNKLNIDSTLYVGPEITDNIASLARGLDRTVDYGWLWVISVGFFWILKNIYKFVGNWGLAIILVTLLIKLVFYKLSESSCRSMAHMKELMPKMQALKERYGDDRQKLHQATMELYKKEKINPLNLGGCLPMLIQIPFFIALYYVLISAVELRHAPFILWIQDLSARDPYYILPILMGLSMFLQQKLSPTSADPTQAKMMMFMPLIFTVFFLNFPAGLVLYWLVSNVLSILQQWYINKKLESCKKAVG